MFVIPLDILILLVFIGILGGLIAGIGGPGGIPVLIVLNLVISLTPSIAAATASSIFVIATITATGLYYHSDGINWTLAAAVGFPALVGTHIGARVSPQLSVRVFEFFLGGVLLLAAAGIVYQQRGMALENSSRIDKWGETASRSAITFGSLLIGMMAGITGLGGPALTIPLMIFFGINPIVAIGAGLASGILITINTTLGHVLQGNLPALFPFAVIGIPYILSQVIGWKYVHTVSDKSVSYTIAGIAILGGLFFII